MGPLTTFQGIISKDIQSSPPRAFCITLFLLPNARLQARAARGASSCKPLFGGTHT
jgi:hypothetical protein